MDSQGVRRETCIALAGAKSLIEAAIARAMEMERRVAVVVLDRSGRLVAAQCMDACVNSAFEVAWAKARHSANFRRPTKFQQDLLTNDNILPILAIPGMMPLEGGLEIQADGETIGAVGVAGGSAADDGAIALKGIVSAGFASGESGILPSR